MFSRVRVRPTTSDLVVGYIFVSKHIFSALVRSLRENINL